MNSLVWLGLYDNDLSGGIPSSLGALANLEVLYLHGNMLTGSVSASIGNLSALTDLWLKDNQLDGELPGTLDKLDNLVRVRISGNSFTGCGALQRWIRKTTISRKPGLEVCPSGINIDRGGPRIPSPLAGEG